MFAWFPELSFICNYLKNVFWSTNSLRDEILYISLHYHSYVLVAMACQKQRPEVFYSKRCSLKLRKSHRKTLVPEYLFKQNSRPLTCNFIKKKRILNNAFQWSLQNFEEQLFYRTPTGDCFCLLVIMEIIIMRCNNDIASCQ